MDFLRLPIVKKILINLAILNLLFVFHLNYVISTVGWCIIFACISWNASKYFNHYFNKEYVPTEGKGVIVTGCDSGFGYEIAILLNSKGFVVFAFCLDPTTSDLRQRCKFKDNIILYKVDVTNDDDIKQAKQSVNEYVKQNNILLWGLVNNAGIAIIGEVEWGTDDDFKRVIDVNAVAVAMVTRAFLPLIRNSKGRVVNIASIYGRNTTPGFSAYAMSKHAVVAFSDTLRREMKRWSVDVVLIEPEFYKTPLVDSFRNHFERTYQGTDEQVKDDYGQEHYNYYLNSDKVFGRLIFRSDIFEVVGAVVHSLVIKNPETRYRCGGVLSIMILTIFEHLPSEILDWVISVGWFKPSK